MFGFSDRRRLRDAEASLESATTYATWLAAAEAHDRLTGRDAWRAEPESECYDASLLVAEIGELRKLREQKDGRGLAQLLTASVMRHLADISAPELYDQALAGTKHLVGRWYDAVEEALLWLAATAIPGMPAEEKRARFEQACFAFGRSALMLSGGATWGFVHLGVVKALFAEGVLPQILSGASTGAMIAAGTCTRNDAELTALFADLDSIRRDGLLPVGWSRAMSAGAWLDPERLHEVIETNVGDWTFAEAYAHSKRVLNIPVSPTRTRQKPHVLSYITAPDVLIARAAQASSAVPGLFPPVMLEARVGGRRVPHIPTERWVDGSIYEDLPKLRLARLHNVNHFIVSQTNPHVAPFASLKNARGMAPIVAGVAGSTARTQGTYAADLARRLAPAWSGPVQQLADRAHALVSQEYGGNITITPRFRLGMLGKIVANPTREDLALLVREGELAAWSRLAMIKDQTRLDRVFRRCLDALRPTAEASGASRPASA